MQFPLRIDASRRYLVDSAGNPFLLLGDTPWSLVAQLTNAEIDRYLDDRAEKGFTAILFNAPEAYYTSQTPSYNNVNGVAPFRTMSPVDWATPNETYWQRVDYAVNGAKARGMVCIINPAYWGYDTDGWYRALAAASVASLQAYGAWLANRYTQGNIIWSMGGDNMRTASDRNQQWHIITGMRTVRTTDIITAHGQSGDESWRGWNGYTGWNLNHTYCYETDGVYAYIEAANAYERTGPIPFIFFEGKYENSTGATAAMLRRQTYQTMLSGGCGVLYGNLPIWNFESTRWTNESWTGTWESHLGDSGAVQQSYAKSLFAAYQWWKLQPKTDTTLVTSNLRSNATRVCPALASDGTFAMVYVPGSQTVTINKAALTVNPLRIRLYDPTAGTYSTHTASTSNGGTVSVATGDEGIIVLDAAA